MSPLPLVCACLLFLTALAPSARAGERLRLTLDTPTDGTRVANDDGRVFLSGRALALSGQSGEFDVVVVIDQSMSTAAPSGADVDGDGELGRKTGSRLFFFLTWMFSMPSTDPGDSILAAEIAAARTLLGQLDPATTRVGVVAFSGDRRPDTRDAFTAVPLTSNFRKVERALDRLLAEGPHGRTHIEAAVRTAAVELGGGHDALSDPRPDARRIVLFMTDGQPTLPDPRSRMDNARAAVAAASQLSRRGIRFDTFAIGKVATADPFVTEGIARVSGGVFTPVEHPKDLVAAFEDLDLADIERLEIRNATTGEVARDVLLDADGSFSAFVPLADGPNRLEVRVRSTHDAEAGARVSVHRVAGAPPQALSARLLERRKRLLENRLLVARERRVAIEAERDEALRRRVQVEMEATRAKRRERARDVEVTAEPSTALPASPAGD